MGRRLLARGAIAAFALFLCGALLASSLFSQTASAAPIVDPNATVLDWPATSPAGADVTLDGSLSSDDITLFAWYEGFDVTRLTPDSIESEIATVPLAIGVHEITLWATTDGSDWTASAPITVTVPDVPAVANAGLDQTVTATGTTTDVSVDGSASTGAVSYSWAIDGVDTGDLTASATFGLEPGVHEATLTVTSIGGVPATDTVTITINPTANAGEDQTVPATNANGAAVWISGSGFGAGFSWSDGGIEFANDTTEPGSIEFAVGVHTITLTVSAPGGLSASDTATITVDPLAVAGADQNVDAHSADGANVTLDGTGSFGDLSWTLDGAEIATGANPAAVELPIGINEITLTASGDAGQTAATDTVTVTVNPVADAGADQTVGIDTVEGANVTLDGTGSAADPASFVWSTIDNPALAIGEEPTLLLAVGTYEITLTVTGPDALVDTDTVTIVVEAPAANPNATQLEWDATTAAGADVALDGSLSSASATSFAWWENCATTPCDDGTRLSPDSIDSKIVTVPLAIGEHEITLWVEDGGVWTASTPIMVYVYPVANAGVDQVVESTNETDAEVTLDGSASIGDLTTIEWILVDGETQSEIATGAEPTVTLPIGINQIVMYIYGPDPGVYDADPVIITVAEAPTADAGADQSVKATSDAGAEVTLDGSASEAAGDATIGAWKWTTETDPIGVTGETATMTLPIGTTTVTLTVVDSNGLTATDSVDVTVTVPAANAGPDQTVTATSANGADVTFDGSASVGEITEWAWSTTTNADLATGESATALLPIGTHEVTLTVTDDEAATDSDTVTIVVEAPEGDATAAVTPERGTVNSSISYEIALFPAESTVTIELVRDGASPIALGTVDTDIIGSASGSVTVPAAPGGDVEIRFTSGDVIASAFFEVAPRIKVIPATVEPGDTVEISLRGFAQQDSVLIRWNVNGSWIAVGTANTSNTGSANIDVVVPANAVAGANSVRADGVLRAQTNAVTVVAPVIPAVTIVPTRGTVNTNVAYTVTGFPANADVHVAWQRPSGSVVQVDVVTTDETGAVSGTFKVPATTGGANQITFTSLGSLVTTVSYEVAPRIKVIPGSVEAGEDVEVSLRGFGKNEVVRIRWNVDGSWVTVATVTTSNTGSANVMVTVPADAEAGPTSVRGDGPEFRAQTNAVTVES